jgi:hypothetical protein
MYCRYYCKSYIRLILNDKNECKIFPIFAKNLILNFYEISIFRLKEMHKSDLDFPLLFFSNNLNQSCFISFLELNILITSDNIKSIITVHYSFDK